MGDTQNNRSDRGVCQVKQNQVMYPKWFEKDEEENTFHFTPKKIITGGFIVLTLVVAVGIVVAVQNPEFFNLTPNEEVFKNQDLSR